MNSVTVIAIIIILLALLVCYAFVSQSLQQKRQYRQRLMAALQIRANNLKYMLNSLPAGFLPRDLTLFVQRSFVEVCEQLMEMDPKNPVPRQDLEAVTQQMSETRKQNSQQAVGAIENAGQINDIKQCLEELYKMIHHQEARGGLNGNEAEAFRGQVRQILLGVTADNYVLHGHQARQQEKARLAQHYYDLAYKLLLREDRSGAFEQKRARIKAWLQELERQVPSAQVVAESEAVVEQAEIEKAWEKFSAAEEGWKKKNIYD